MIAYERFSFEGKNYLVIGKRRVEASDVKEVLEILDKYEREYGRHVVYVITMLIDLEAARELRNSRIRIIDDLRGWGKEEEAIRKFARELGLKKQ